MFFGIFWKILLKLSFFKISLFKFWMAELFCWPLYLFGELIGPIQTCWDWEQVRWESRDYEAYSFLNCSQKWTLILEYNGHRKMSLFIANGNPFLTAVNKNNVKFSWIEATGIYLAQTFLRLKMITDTILLNIYRTQQRSNCK